MIFYYLCDGVHMAAQTWFVLQIMDGLFEPKWVKRKMWVGWGIIMASATLLQVSNSYFFLNVFSNGVLIFLIFSTVIIVKSLYECSTQNILWLDMLSWIGMALVDFFIQTCAYLVLDKYSRQKDVLLSVTKERAVYLAIYTAVIIFAGIRLRRWLISKKQEVLNYQKQGMVLGFFLFPILIYFQRVYVKQVSERLLNQWWIFWLALTIVVLAFWFNIVRQKAEEEKRIQELEAALLDERYQELVQVYNDKSILIHDMRNHLRTMLETIEEKKIEKCRDYLVQITGEIRKKEILPWTNHKILDMIFNMKFREAERAGIRVKCLSDDLSGLELTTAEICSFFTNLLDNAIEASIKSKEKERQIRIVCRRKGRMLVVSISNPIEKGENYLKGQIITTTKKDKNMHGLGMLSIENVIRGRDGYIKTDITGNKFQVIAYLNGFIDE